MYRGEVEEAAGYKAKKGEQIVGKLFRGEGGKFQSGPSDAELETIGIDRAMSDSLISALEGKELTSEQLDSLIKSKYITSSGKLTLQARTIANALKSKNIAIAKALIGLQNPKAGEEKPTKGGGGGGGKGGKEEKATKASKEDVEAQNVEKMKSELGDSVDIDSLLAFDSGDELDSEVAQALAAIGAIEPGQEGEYRMTTAGKALLRAIKKGDKRAALDAISRGKEVSAKAKKETEKKAAEPAKKPSGGRFKLLA